MKNADPNSEEGVMTPSPKNLLCQFATKLQVTQFLSYREFLRELYAVTKAQTDGYSYLRFAEDLGFSRTNVMRLVIVGERPLTSKAADRVATALALHGSNRRYWTTLVKYANERLPATRDHLFQLLMSYKTKAQPIALGAVEAEYFSEWYHPVIREMTALAGFDGSAEWLKNRLVFPLRLEQIKRSLELLVKRGYVVFDRSKGRYVRSEQRLTTDAEVDSLAVVRYHQKMIEIGRESITTVEEGERDVRAVTVTLPRARIALLKGKIEEWVNEIAAMEQDGVVGDEVIQVNVQMFPFTKTRGEKP